MAGENLMFDHIGLSVRDLSKTRAFYTAALAPLGFAIRYEQDKVIAFGPPGKAALWFYGKGGGPTGVHIALAAITRVQVNAFHAAALGAGGKDNGAPGLRLHYKPTYYGAFVIDPDGHNLEAVCYADEA
jgi:catechol 2,3-dioxygenase-like lactoylglutathione lyase family enzyme